MDICVLFLSLTVLSDISLSNAVNPGLKARITPAGLNYANKIAIDTLSEKVSGQSIPDVHGSSGKVSYDLTSLRITGFVKPSSSITLNPPTGLRWTASGTSLSLHGNWHYKYKKGWFKVSDHGSFDVSIKGLSFKLAIKLGRDNEGRPSISSNGCSCDIDRVDIHFHGGLSWIYNLFKGAIGKKIKNALKGKFCDIAGKAIDENAEKALKKLKVTTKIAKDFMLDYRLVSNPSFTSSYMETYHKGEVLWASSMKDAPFAVPPIPDIADTQKMLYLGASDYLFNTFAYQAQKHDLLKYNLTAKDLPPSKRGVLNTSCTGGMCIGMLIPQISKKYPHRQVELHMKSTHSPEMRTENNSIKVLSGGFIEMYATEPNSHPVYLVTLNTSMDSEITLSIKNEKIYGKIQDLKFKVSAFNSTVGNINNQSLQFLINSAVKIFVEPQLNALGQNGFPLPTTGNVRFVNTALTLVQNTLIIATDVQYHSDDDNTLRFAPQDTVYLKYSANAELLNERM